MLIAMLQHPRAAEFDCSSLRMVISGGTPIPVPVLEQVKAQFGADPVIGFGMTEARPMVTGTRTDDSFELQVGDRRHAAAARRGEDRRRRRRDRCRWASPASCWCAASA